MQQINGKVEKVYTTVKRGRGLKRLNRNDIVLRKEGKKNIIRAKLRI